MARTLRDVFGWNRPFPPELLPREMRRLMERGGILVSRGALEVSAARFSTLDGLIIMHSPFPTIDKDAVFFGPDTYKFVDSLEASFRSAQVAPRRAADLCTGAGPAALTIAARYPTCDVAMVDINERALFFAKSNAAAAGLTNASAPQQRSPHGS